MKTVHNTFRQVKPHHLIHYRLKMNSSHLWSLCKNLLQKSYIIEPLHHFYKTSICQTKVQPFNMPFHISSNIIQRQFTISLKMLKWQELWSWIWSLILLQLQALGTVGASKELNEFPHIFKRLTGRTAFLC